MNDWKYWYESKGIWGSVVSVLAVGASLVGYAVTPEIQAAVVAVVDEAVAVGLAVAALVGNALALYGRIKATKVIE